ncbi:MAG: S9 family peptidase [Aristaeellaceae bacterium]
MPKRLPQFSDTWSMERLNGGDWYAAGQLVCYASNRTEGIVIRDLAHGTQRTVTAGGRGEGYPRFSPDGSRVLFCSSLPGKGRQVCVADLTTEEVHQVSDINGAAMEPIWSPDGKKILFASSQGSGGKRTQARADEPIVIEHFNYKFEGAGYITPDGHVQLFVSDLTTGETRQLTQGAYNYMHHCWSPDSQHIAFCGNQHRGSEESIGFDLYLLDIDAPSVEQAVQLSHDLTMVSYPNPIRPVFTADGNAVIMGALNPDADMNKGYPESYLFRFAADGSGQEQIFQPDDGCFQCVQFPYNAFAGAGMDKVQLDAATGDVYFVSGWNGQGNLYRLPQGHKHAEVVIGGKQCCHGLSAIREGKMLVAQVTATQAEAYWLVDIRTGEKLCKAVQSNQQLLDEVELSEVEDFFFDTLDGESRVHGFVMPPQHREPGKKYPTILYVHGGPHPFYTFGLTMEFQCFAAEGFGVIFCNPRGSSGYGVKHLNMQRAFDGSAYMDCLQMVEEAVRRCDWIDSSRMGLTGGSYGGYMTNYMATHCSRFKAYITQRSVCNALIDYASSDMQGRSMDYKSFEEFMVHELERSTVSYAERVNAPLLILHGEDDLRCPVEGAHQLFIAVKDTHPDLPVKLMIFPHTGHDQPTDPRLLKRYYAEMVSWFRTWL